MKKFKMKITTTVEMSYSTDNGETIEQFKNRDCDIYLHGSGPHGHEDKTDLGGNTTIEITEVETIRKPTFRPPTQRICEFMGIAYVPEDVANYSEIKNLMDVVAKIDNTTTLSSIKEPYKYCVELGGSVARVTDGKNGDIVVNVSLDGNDWAKTTYSLVISFISWYNLNKPNFNPLEINEE